MRVTSRLSYAGLSDTGRLRRENEDRIYMDADRGIFLVVDGLGGHAAGERAAETAVEMIVARLQRQTGTTEERIREAIAVANNEIYRLANEHEELRGMACVVTLAVIDDDQVVAGHVGDSRLYQLELGAIRKLTHDHSPVGEREDAGELTERAAMTHPRRNEVFRDLGSEQHGPDDEDFIEILRFRFRSSMAFLLCSDGLSDQLTSEQIRSLVEAHETQAAVTALVEAANEAGGKDNVSVVLVEGPGYRRSAPTERLPVPTARSGWLVPFLIGCALVFGALLLARPHFIRTPTGTQLRFGIVHTPVTWVVGTGALATISDALARAEAGDTIEVEPGVYREDLQLRDGVHVLSRTPRTATIEGTAVVVLADGVKGARLAGFRITGTADVGIRMVNSDLEITDVEVTGMKHAGIEVGEGSTGVIRANRITGNPGFGVLIHEAARPVISHNLIAGNGKGGERARPGIQVTGSATPTITGNIIMDNGVEQIWVSPLFNVSSLLATNVIAPGAKDKSKQIKVVAR